MHSSLSGAEIRAADRGLRLSCLTQARGDPDSLPQHPRGSAESAAAPRSAPGSVGPAPPSGHPCCLPSWSEAWGLCHWRGLSSVSTGALLWMGGQGWPVSASASPWQVPYRLES